MKHAVITGASRGIGFETATQLVQRGYKVLALSRNEEALKKLKSVAGEHLDYLPYDISHTDCRDLIAILEKYTKVDVLVNNAGALINKAFHELTPDDWYKVYEVNVFGVVRMVQQLRPYLEAAPNAHIVNIGSMGGFQGSSKFPGLSAYSSSKAALANFTECLAEEWKDKGIACNCLALGAVKTEMLAAAFPGFEPPLTSAEMGAYVAQFADEGHRFYNGKILPVALSTP